MLNLLLFAGTSEGRKLTEALLADGRFHLTVCVITEYAQALLPQEQQHLCILRGRRGEKEIEALLLENRFDLAIDATHPYAQEVTQNLRTACARLQLPYRRLRRSASDVFNDQDTSHDSGTEAAVRTVNSFDSAAAALAAFPGNVMLTTGSTHVEVFCSVPDYQNRFFPRVLPTVEAIEKCLSCGYLPGHILAMQGPFSELLNRALIEQFSIRTLVTKESGKAGGFHEKLAAAKHCGTRVLVIRRPAEDNTDQIFSYNELLAMVQNAPENGIGTDTKGETEADHAN